MWPNPYYPYEAGYYTTLDVANGVALSGTHAYVAYNTSGLRILDVRAPSPYEEGYYDTPGWAYGVAVSESIAYVADGESGLEVYQFYGGGVEEAPNAEVTSANRMPTVVRGVLRVEDRGRKTGDRTELLDISGRKVLDLHPGANDISRLSPGVYFVREAQAQAVWKIVVTR